VTLNGIAHIVTPDLARDLSPELIGMLNHSRAHIRKRAILALYKILVKYPESAKYARARLEEKLEDPDQSIQFVEMFLCSNRSQVSSQPLSTLSVNLLDMIRRSICPLLLSFSIYSQRHRTIGC
jgi:AP-3 complex subunit delta-1